MEYKVEYLLGLTKRETYKSDFESALSYAEQLYTSGVKYICVKDEDNVILIEFEN